MKTITITWLREKDACADQVELFKQTFGESVTLTKRNIMKAARAGLHLSWFARRYLSPTALKAYQEAEFDARKTYQEATATALKAYQEADGAAWKAYREVGAAAWKAYREVGAAARKAYDEAIDAACKAFNAATAAALWEAIKMEQVK